MSFLRLTVQLILFVKSYEVISFIGRLNDRFGTPPKAIHNVCDTLRVRWLAKKIGFERIILKNNSMNTYFPSQPDSPYFNSDVFKNCLDYLKSNFNNCKMIEKNGKLSICIKNIRSIEEALNICKEINNKPLNQQ